MRDLEVFDPHVVLEVHKGFLLRALGRLPDRLNAIAAGRAVRQILRKASTDRPSALFDRILPGAGAGQRTRSRLTGGVPTGYQRMELFEVLRLDAAVRSQMDCRCP